jgi:hypothetical protein
MTAEQQAAAAAAGDTLKRLLTGADDNVVMARKSRRKSKYVHNYVSASFNNDFDYADVVDNDDSCQVNNCDPELISQFEVYANGADQMINDHDDSEDVVVDGCLGQPMGAVNEGPLDSEDLEAKLKRIESNQNLILTKLDAVLDNLKYLNGSCLMKTDFNTFLKRLFDQSENLVSFETFA